MDNYEINILRRDGNWKKVKPDDLIMESIEDNDEAKKENINPKDTEPKNNFINYINDINSIISKLETLENEKNILKNQLKNYEQEFINKKKNAEHRIILISREKEMNEKTMGVIKNLKTF